jgi:hypothetical protein
MVWVVSVNNVSHRDSNQEPLPIFLFHTEISAKKCFDNLINEYKGYGFNKDDEFSDDNTYASSYQDQELYISIEEMEIKD